MSCILKLKTEPTKPVLAAFTHFLFLWMEPVIKQSARARGFQFERQESGSRVLVNRLWFWKQVPLVVLQVPLHMLSFKGKKLILDLSGLEVVN